MTTAIFIQNFLTHIYNDLKHCIIPFVHFKVKETSIPDLTRKTLLMYSSIGVFIPSRWKFFITAQYFHCDTLIFFIRLFPALYFIFQVRKISKTPPPHQEQKQNNHKFTTHPKGCVEIINDAIWAQVSLPPSGNFFCNKPHHTVSRFVNQNKVSKNTCR